MRNIKFFIAALVSLLWLNSCEGDLLDKAPYGEIGSGNMWDTENLADMGVNGVYNALRLMFVGNERWMLDQDGFTGMDRDRTSWIMGTSTFKSGVITSGDGMFTNYWRQHYEGIHRANDALHNLAERAPLSDEKRARLMAEVKFLRAMYYFQLNQVYKGVPVYLEPLSADDLQRPRESEAKVWQVIIDDLTACVNETHLPNSYAPGNAGIGRVTKAAALALRGKTYLYMGEHGKAEADLRAVGDLGLELYQGDYAALFTEAHEDHPEMIFSVQNIALPGLGTRTQKHVGSRVMFGSNWNNYLPHPDFVESFENADGTPFSWDDYLPGYSDMTPRERSVFFLRDGLTPAETAAFEDYGADMSQYLPEGNEARLRTAYDNRDPRLEALVITPYSTFYGSPGGTDEYTYTLRWPYRGADRAEPFDIRTDTNNRYYYLWRKWVYEGTQMENREYGPINKPIIRYADVVLMLAEAINEQRGGDIEAIGLVNSIRQRAGMPDLENVSGQNDLRERIRNERRWEFALEGINLFDEMRWGTWEDIKFYEGNGAKQIWGEIQYLYGWVGDHAYTWAIPRVEIERNENLIQNPGWD